MSTVIKVCNPAIEDCSEIAAYAEKDNWMDVLAVSLFMTFDFFFSFVPLILHYTWFEPKVLSAGTWGGLIGWIVSWFSWIANLLTYAPVLLWAPFAFFPEVFGTGMMDLFLEWNYNSVVLTGTGVSSTVLFFWLLAAIGTMDADIWAWWAAQLVLYGGMYFTYYFMLANWNEFFAYRTYVVLAAQAEAENESTIEINVNL